MADTWKCLQCGKRVTQKTTQCPDCGYMRYGENNEYAPTEAHMELARKMLQNCGRENVRQGVIKKSKQNKAKHEAPATTKTKKKRWREYSEEEILGMGAYPKDEKYKMSLISIILGRK